MYIVAICDDNISELDELESILHLYQETHSDVEFEIHRFKNVDKMLDMVREKNYRPSLLILDIYMPQKLGTTAAKEFREVDSEAKIIFLTSSLEHALEAFRVNASQYLIKPVSEEELFPVLDKVFAELEEEKKKYLLFRTEGKIYRVELNKIIYCESQGKTQCLHLIEGKKMQVRMTMTKLYEMFCLYAEFVKVGISYIVNLRYVESLNAQYLYMTDGTNIHLPRGAYKPLREQYFQYYCGEENMNL